MKFEALDSPPDVDEVEIICQIDRSPLLPWDYEVFSLDLWYDSEGSGSEESMEEDEELVGEDNAEVEDEVDVEGEEGADGEGYEDDCDNDRYEDEECDDWDVEEEEAADEEGYIENEEWADDGYGDGYDDGYESEEYDDEEYEDKERDDEGYEDGECANRGLRMENSNQESETVSTTDSCDGIAANCLVAWFRSIGITVEDSPDVAVKAPNENPLFDITLYMDGHTRLD